MDYKWRNNDESSDSIAAYMAVVRDSQPNKPIMLTVCINGKSVEMELDTGAIVTVIPKKKFDTLLPGVLLAHSEV